MPTGPRAKSLVVRVRSMETLLQAWHAIRRNGETSRSRKTREETKKFGAELPRKLRKIQERLRKPPYQFARQIGATPEKAKGNGKRPLVIAPIEDRIVQRAILDVLQDTPELGGVQQVLATPTSIGGIRGRGVELAIELIEAAYASGQAKFVAGSDISGFFTKIRQSEVVDFIRQQTADTEFIDLFARALKVDLANANDMSPDDLRMFPTDDVGVAQGCPLSAFAGNVVLREFDAQFNSKGITCIRFIDDFILLGEHRANVTKAFENAGKWLQKLGMAIYRAEDRPDKVFFGQIGREHEFLGYKLTPGIYPPASKNRQHLLESVQEEFSISRAHILRALNDDPLEKPLQLYAQALVAVDRIVRAWSGSFGASRCLKTAVEMDEAINAQISNFIAFYRDNTNRRSQLERRRALGVHVLADDIRARRLLDSVKT
jgi:RNA-directed DNA polymerase